MNNIRTLKKNPEFQEVYNKGFSTAKRAVVLFFLYRGHREKRFGFSVSKKIGNAVVRNSIRRKLKEICRLNRDRFPESYDFVIIARRNSAESSYRELEQQLGELAEKAHEISVKRRLKARAKND